MLVGKTAQKYAKLNHNWLCKRRLLHPRNISTFFKLCFTFEYIQITSMPAFSCYQRPKRELYLQLSYSFSSYGSNTMNICYFKIALDMKFIDRFILDVNLSVNLKGDKGRYQKAT